MGLAGLPTMRAVCPMGWSEKRGGNWLLTIYEVIWNAARTVGLSSSAKGPHPCARITGAAWPAISNGRAGYSKLTLGAWNDAGVAMQPSHETTTYDLLRNGAKQWPDRVLVRLESGECWTWTD